jgi:uncharacterized membrane protein YfbV (UPF0208 family)
MSISIRTESFKNLPNEDVSVKTVENSNKVEIVITDMAKKVFPSLALIYTNTFLSLMVGVSKLTGFAIFPSYIIGHATKSLHQANISLAKHAFTPLKDWAVKLGDENKRIIETDKVIDIIKEKITFYPTAYKKQAEDSLKIALVPISLGLNAFAAGVWLLTKSVYLVFLTTVLPNSLLRFPATLNRDVGRLTYPPLAELSERMYQRQQSVLRRDW